MYRSSDVLNSWKEIAVYLDRSVRSVQRWENDCGLPVRRINPASEKSPVIASRVELDEWIRSRKRQPVSKNLQHSRHNRGFPLAPL
jgi:hypothetical protein